ncbi:N-acetylmuramoyl-L-alanine amidase [Streptomyces nanhaiensis]|uniref:N-acetylmuramoyl-L-alanine amidase n=1 Tax=Streptomyces nanhaiensis TaxID=679319 RepID=UPI00399C5F1B
MATPLSADRALRAFRDEGLTIREYGLWRSHNRNHKGPWGGVNGVVIHHTAGRDSLRLCYEGTSGLPGPLCHSHLSKTGVVTMVGWGRCNHAGTFAQNAHDAVVAERSAHPRPDSAEPVDGNRHYYGIEVENLGDGRDWYPSVQYDAAVRWAAALCRAHGWTAQSVIGHKEGTRRKIDPRGPVGRPDGPAFDMDRFRRDVQQRLDGAASSSEESDVAISDADAKKIARAVWETDGIVGVSWGSETNPEWKPESVVNHIGEVTRENRGRIKALQAAVAELAAQGAARDAILAQLAAGGGLDAAEIRAAAEAGAQAFADRLGDALTTEA